MHPNFYALLIGVDCYISHELPGGGYYPCLGGCVRDIVRVEMFLRGRLNLAPANILKLSATYTGPQPSAQVHPYLPAEQDPAQWPTHDNIIAAFQRLTAMAAPGDQVYIHYSGHGGRTVTRYPDLKGANGLDEGLVPTDIGKPTADYVRDVELIHLLQTMVDKGLIVTIVLDCCHSGGATRGLSDAVARGISEIDTTQRTPGALVPPVATLAAAWNRATGGGTRNLKLGSGWLPEPQGYTLLAACRVQESAYEYAIDGGFERSGALTYWMVDAIKQLGAGATYKMLQSRILASVHSLFEAQTPQLQGEGDRIVLGTEMVETMSGIDVLQVEPARVKIQTGQAQGLREGAQFAIFPAGADFADAAQRLALAKLTDLGAADSWATITDTLRPEPIQKGAQAVVLETGNVNLQRTVAFVSRTDLPAHLDQAAALDRVREALVVSGTRFVHPAGAGELITLQVALNAAGAYEIWDLAGVPLRNLGPVPISAADAATKVARRLIHLAKYWNVRELANYDSLSPLAGKLVVELAGKMGADYDPADPPRPQSFNDPGGTPTVMPGEWVFLRVRNNLPPTPDPRRPWLNTLNITVLDLAPDWSISKVYPSDDLPSMPVDAGSELPLLPLQASLPPGADEATDIIKVFATLGTGTTDFDWLTLPALDEQPATKGTRGLGANDPLSQMLASVVENEPATRNLSPAAYPNRGWVVAQVELHVGKM